MKPKSKEFKDYSQVGALQKIIDWKSRHPEYREIDQIKFRITSKTQQWVATITYE